VRTLARLLVMMFLALLVVACGDDDDGDATEEAATEAVVSTEAADETATTTADETEEAPADSTVGTPAMSASPATTGAVPGVGTPASAIGTPAATPVTLASPVAAATPQGAVAAAPVPAGAGDADAATPATEMVTLRGEVVLPGTLNETFVITDEGCVGLNGHADMRAGRQLVVRDEAGTIVGVTELAASDATDACSWTFSLDVPESGFYAVSIPMAVEHVFTQEQVEASNGEITVPLG
jgi:hypothetical protein